MGCRDEGPSGPPEVIDPATVSDQTVRDWERVTGQPWPGPMPERIEATRQAYEAWQQANPCADIDTTSGIDYDDSTRPAELRDALPPRDPLTPDHAEQQRTLHYLLVGSAPGPNMLGLVLARQEQTRAARERLARFLGVYSDQTDEVWVSTLLARSDEADLTLGDLRVLIESLPSPEPDEVACIHCGKRSTHRVCNGCFLKSAASGYGGEQ